MLLRQVLRVPTHIRPRSNQNDAVAPPPSKGIHVLLLERRIVLQAVNFSDHDGHVAFLEIPARVLQAEVVDVRDAGYIGHSDILFQYRRRQADSVLFQQVHTSESILATHRTILTNGHGVNLSGFPMKLALGTSLVNG